MTADHLLKSGISLPLLACLLGPACAADPPSQQDATVSDAQALELAIEDDRSDPHPHPSGELDIKSTGGPHEVPCIDPEAVEPESTLDHLAVEQGYEPTPFYVAELDKGDIATLSFVGAKDETGVLKTKTADDHDDPVGTLGTLSKTAGDALASGGTPKTTSSSDELAASGELATGGNPSAGGPTNDDLDIADVPGSCEEQGMVHFGPIPHGMPPVKFPIFNWCDGEECPQVALAWIRAHHNAWRMSQLFEYMATLHPEQRRYAWDRPGVRADGSEAHYKSRPSYWFGPYSTKRWEAALEAVRDYWTVVRNAKTGSTNIRVQCPSFDDQEHHPCITAPSFGSSPLGMHITKGYINVCPPAFQNPPPFGSPSTTQQRIDATVAHEPLHHIFTTYNGEKALTDTKLHYHGNACAADAESAQLYLHGLETTAQDPILSHFNSYTAPDGDDCSHAKKLVLAVDTYAQYARAFGTLVRTGEMTNWPKWADPTPQPPACVGDIGCLCEATPDDVPPDGNYADDMYCEDNETEPTVCMKTKFNASDTVGICTNCADYRGPGCECNDVTQPCDEGFCYGQDSGPGNMTGMCYGANPPDFACLANCEGVMGNGAYCMTDNPDGGRCVPYGTARPFAHNCWLGGGFVDPDGECEQYECGPSAIPAHTTCQDLGYPGIFVCDQTSFRCVPNP